MIFLMTTLWRLLCYCEKQRFSIYRYAKIVFQKKNVFFPYFKKENPNRLKIQGKIVT